MKIITICILLISSIGKLFLTESIELTLIESGFFTWKIAPILIRGITIFEFVIALSLLFKTINYKVQAVLLGILSFFYITDLFSKPVNGLFNSYFLLSLFNYWVVISSAILLLIFVLISFKQKIKTSFSTKKRLLINSCFVLIIASPLFVINPIYIDDFQQNKTIVEKPNLKWDKIYEYCKDKGISVDDDTEIFFSFFSTSCYFCNQAAIKLGVTGRKRNPNSKIILVFPGNKEDTESFIERNKCNFPFIRISKDEFRALAGNEYPAFFRVKNGEETHYFTGETFNYRELDALFN